MTDDVLDTLVVPTQLGGARVDRVVAELFELPTNAARRLCERGRVFVDGKKVKKGDRVNPGAVVFLQGGGTWLVPVDDATVHTLYVDDELVIVDKPALMPCHPLVPQEGGTALDLVAARYPDVAEGFEEPREGGLLHRLDTGTSGCLAFARDPIVRQRLRGRFEEADKRYLALVEGAVVRSVVVDLPVGHDPKDPRRMLVDDDGREAQTDLAPRGVGQGPQGPVSLVELTLHGGRRHQLRVHLADLGHPIVGDVLYGSSPRADVEGFLLHAWRLRLPGKPLVTAPVPPAFVATARAFGITLP